jgi:transcription elongation factor Elf1
VIIPAINFKRHIEGFHKGTVVMDKSGEITLNPDGNWNIHKCTLCPYASYTQNGLKTHMKRHVGEKNFKCEVCEKLFLTSDQLKMHSGEKRYKCEICKKAFSLPGTSRKHKVVHIEERNLTCEFCGISLKTNQQLLYHYKAKHLDVKPHQYPEFLSCDKKSSLKQHSSNSNANSVFINVIVNLD